jgi:hypothetical protein
MSYSALATARACLQAYVEKDVLLSKRCSPTIFTSPARWTMRLIARPTSRFAGQIAQHHGARSKSTRGRSRSASTVSNRPIAEFLASLMMLSASCLRMNPALRFSFVTRSTALT